MEEAVKNMNQLMDEFDLLEGTFNNNVDAFKDLDNLQKNYTRLGYLLNEFDFFIHEYQTMTENQTILDLIFSIIKIKVKIYNLSKRISEILVRMNNKQKKKSISFKRLKPKINSVDQDKSRKMKGEKYEEENTKSKSDLMGSNQALKKSRTMDRFNFKKKSDSEPIDEDEEIRTCRTELKSSGDNELSIQSHRDYSENEDNHPPLSPLSQSEYTIKNITKSTSPLGDKFNQFNCSTSILPIFKKKTSLENNEEKTVKDRQLLSHFPLSKKPKSEFDLLSLTKNAKRTYTIPELLNILKDDEKGIKRHVYLIPPTSSEDLPEVHHAFFESDYFTYMKKTLNYTTKDSEICLNKLITKNLVETLPKSQFGSKKRYSFSQSEFLNEKQKEDLNFNILQSFKSQNNWLFNFSEPFLHNKTCSKYLRQNLISDFTSENLEFYILCQQYENTSSVETRKELGKKIYSNFIDKGIINLNSDTIEDLDKIFDSYSVDIFKKAKEEIKYLIDSDCFPRFIYSKYFFKILKKMFKENV